MTKVSGDIAAIAAGLSGAQRRLAERTSARWIKGTGFCHSSVGRDLETLKLVESRNNLTGREIRATSLGLAVRSHLLPEKSND